MEEPLKMTPLHDWHVQHGGRMVPFAGWEMPVQYPTGPLLEHDTTRTKAGLFDIDHMGQMEIRGPQAETFVNHLVTFDVTKMKLYDAHYSVLCYPDGTCVDDLFIYKLPDEQAGGIHPYFFIAINASNREKDIAWTQAQAAEYDVTVEDISDPTCMLALQGPLAIDILSKMAGKDLYQIPRFTSGWCTFFGNVKVLLGRTGYTGEDGFELYFPAQHAPKMWEGILSAGETEGVKPIGLAARDSLRFEACMPLYGHEINASITPVEAGLGFALSLDKPFIGRDALLKQKLEKSDRVTVGIEMVEKGLAREHYPVLVDGVEVGWVTSGMYAPTLQKYLGMALIPRSLAVPGAEVYVSVRGKPVKAKIIKRPFYKPAYRR